MSAGINSDLSILWWMVPGALVLGLGFLYAFVKTVKSGQYEDLESPAVRILFEGEKGNAERKPE